MPNTREKLIELLEISPQLDVLDWTTGWQEAANYLISKGVTIPVRCGECDWYREDGSICVNPKCTKSYYGCPVPPVHFCSYGERRNNDCC